jgi:hypothetical protein
LGEIGCDYLAGSSLFLVAEVGQRYWTVGRDPQVRQQFHLLDVQWRSTNAECLCCTFWLSWQFLINIDTMIILDSTSLSVCGFRTDHNAT